MNHVTFNVVSTGEISDGFDPSDVEQKLIQLLRLKPEQAAVFFNRPRVLKKGLSKAEADKLGQRIAKFGIGIEIQKIHPQIQTASDGLVADLEPQTKPQDVASAPANPASVNSSTELSLEPLDADEPAPDKNQPKVDTNTTITCPKCQHEQLKSEQCVNCEVWFHKLEQTVEADSAVSADGAVEDDPVAAQISNEEDWSSSESDLNLKAIGAAAAAALLGALVWKIIAVTFDYELGLIAWAIGGAVGFAAASFGSQGVKAGVICGALAFAAIGIGKFWAAQSFIEEFKSSLVSTMDENVDLTDIYDELMMDAQVYAEGSGSDAFTRQFMIDRGYSEATQTTNIGQEELTQFKEYHEPELREVAQTLPDYEQWKASMFGELDAISSWDMVKDGLGILDIIFLLLGVGTAFRLGSRIEQQ